MVPSRPGRRSSRWSRFSAGLIYSVEFFVPVPAGRDGNFLTNFAQKSVTDIVLVLSTFALGLGIYSLLRFPRAQPHAETSGLAQQSRPLHRVLRDAAHGLLVADEQGDGRRRTSSTCSSRASWRRSVRRCSRSSRSTSSRPRIERSESGRLRRLSCWRRRSSSCSGSVPIGEYPDQLDSRRRASGATSGWRT